MAGRYIKPEKKAHTLSGLWMKKYGERSITVLSSVKNPDNVRHWIARPLESLGLNAGCARAGERKAP